MKNYIIICISYILISINLYRLNASENIQSMNEQQLYISDSSQSSECVNEECIMAAYRIQYNMNPNTAPCADFYNFTCGGYLEYKFTAPDENLISSEYEIISDDKRYIRNFIEKIDIEKAAGPYKNLKRFYNNCVNLDFKNHDEILRTHHRLANLGGWPVLTQVHYQHSFHWAMVIFNIYNLGLSADYLYKFSIEADPIKPYKYILTIDQPILEFSKEIFEKYPDMPFEIEQYYSYMVDVALSLGGDRERAAEHLSKTIEFEYKLSRITLAKEDILKVNDKKARYFVTELMRLTPNLHWGNFINFLLDEAIYDFSNETIIVKTLPYFVELSKLIGDTSEETLANYLIWKMISESAPFINDELRLRTFEYHKIFNGPAIKTPIWSECIDVIKQYYPGMVNALFVINENYEKSQMLRNATIEIIDEIKMSLIETLKTTSMDELIKDYFLKKIGIMSCNVGFPMQRNDYTKTMEYYDVDIYSNNYFESMLLLTNRHREFSIKRYKRSNPLDDAWIKRINTPLYGILYDPRKNSIDIGIGNLNSLYIYTTIPYYVRFAGIGIRIGRLITQIYDHFEKEVHSDGTLTKWCQLYCDQPYIHKSDCVVTQYNYFLRQIHLPPLGNVTKYQNIADLHGVNIAYQAYEKWLLTNHNEELQLPGQDYTNKQMFWIWYGNTHCTLFNPFAYRNLIGTGNNVDPKFRVNGPLANSKHFNEDFNCNSIDHIGSWTRYEHRNC